MTRTPEQKHEARVHVAQETSRLLAALKMLETTDFTTMMGSGILVSLRPITRERCLADEFMIAAEDMATIAPVLAKSLRRSLVLRLMLRKSEVRDISRVLGDKEEVPVENQKQ